VSNPLLSPTYSQWLVGPIGRMASREEIAAYLGLSSDEAAAAFIEAFWERRDPYPLREDNPLRDTFEARAAEADRLYSEAGYLGRRTARGTVYVLYGEPEEVDYEVSPHPDDPPITVWKYPADAPPGLDGRQPERWVRFIKRGDLTEDYRPLRTPAADRPRVHRPGTPTRPVDFPEPPR
jgi:GWxTD domain-containing protein